MSSSSASSSIGSVGLGNSMSLGKVGNYSADAAKGQQVAGLVKQMKANAAAWWQTSGSQRAALETQNEQLASQVGALLGQKLVKGRDGVWYIGSVGSEQLFHKYHEGGIVGDDSNLKDEETFAILKDGELVLNSGQKENLYRLVDTSKEYGQLLKMFSTSVFGDGTLNNAVSKFMDIAKNGNKQAMNQISNDNGNNAVAVDASITIQGDVDKDAWTKIYPLLKQHQTQVAEIVNKQTTIAFNRRGVVY